MKLWGGRFQPGGSDPEFERFSESFSVDQRLAAYDLQANIAYVRALARIGVLKGAEAVRLERVLKALQREVQSNPQWMQGQQGEDVHTWVEARLQARLGALAGKLRTGRSRNDLVATGMRLYVRNAVRELLRAILDFQAALISQARAHAAAVMPGYTHLQPAQPILFAHYLLAYFEMLGRDAARLRDAARRAEELPLGAGALAGTGFAIDRERLARDLGFARAARNSLDVTSDRDFVAELLFACSLTLVHLSRLAEDLVIFSNPSLGFVEISDLYSTGSSLMPQKKNADSMELIRGKAAGGIGRLTALLSLLKGLPMAYDRDLQEDKTYLFESVDTTRNALGIAARVVATLGVNEERMKAAAAVGYLTATDVADELVRLGMPFAKAHEKVGRLVRYCAAKKLTFAGVSDAEARKMIPEWSPRLRAVATRPELALKLRNVVGGTAPRQVRRQLAAAERAVQAGQRAMAREAHRAPVR
jgi:argininosuccinate lyase